MNDATRLRWRRLARALSIAGSASGPRQKRAARRAAALAEQLGQVRRPSRCQGCGYAARLTRHHPDHRDPLRIEWLCGHCHASADGIAGLENFPGRTG